MPTLTSQPGNTDMRPGWIEPGEVGVPQFIVVEAGREIEWLFELVGGKWRFGPPTQ